MGELERPSIWRFEFREDPEKHLVLLNLELLNESIFYKNVNDTLGRSNQREILVFVHGYRVSFEDAVLRTAQLAYDLAIDGVPISYSWPSQGATASYLVDETNVEWTTPHLVRFLSQLSSSSGAHSIHLIAHSMGNRALSRALEKIAASQTESSGLPTFNEVLLTAPDIDAAVFKQIADSLLPAAERITLYASSNDLALKASKKIHGGYPRAGESGAELVVIRGLDTVDASLVDTSLIGHSYYGERRSVLADMFQLIRHDLPPMQRFGLAKKDRSGVAYWEFLP